MDTVANNDAQNTVVDGAQDDLDTLLNEYDEGTTTATPQPTPPDLAKVAAYVERQEQKELNEQIERDMNAAVTVLKGEVESLPERLLRGAIHDKAAEDSRFLAAYQNRTSNPAGWNKVLGALANEIKGELQPIDQQATDDSNAVIAAISGSSNTQPGPDIPPDYTKLSDNDFAKQMNEISWG